MRSFVPVQPPFLEYGLLHAHYRYAEYAPDERLRDVICCYWSSAAHPQQDEQLHRIVPDGCIDIIFDLNTRQMNGAFLTSLMRSYEVMHLDEPMAFFGVRMYADQVRRLFGYAGAELTGYHVGLEQWLGRDAASIVERVILADNMTERIQLVDTWLLHLLHERDDQASSLLHTVIQQIDHKRGNVSIRQLAEDTHYSERTLRRLFQQELGMAPKEWADIIRFQAVLRYCQLTDQRLRREQPASHPKVMAGHLSYQTQSRTGNMDRESRLSLSELATAFGYYDQAHLNLAFNRYYGLTPGQLRLRQMYTS